MIAILPGGKPGFFIARMTGERLQHHFQKKFKNFVLNVLEVTQILLL